MTGNKIPVHGRKLCSPCTANFQYIKMEKPTLKTVHDTPTDSHYILTDSPDNPTDSHDNITDSPDSQTDFHDNLTDSSDNLTDSHYTTTDSHATPRTLRTTQRNHLPIQRTCSLPGKLVLTCSLPGWAGCRRAWRVSGVSCPPAPQTG